MLPNSVRLFVPAGSVVSPLMDIGRTGVVFVWTDVVGVELGWVRYRDGYLCS